MIEAIDSTTVKGGLDMMVTLENTVKASSFAAQRLGVDCMDHNCEDPTVRIVDLGREASHGRSVEGSR